MPERGDIATLRPRVERRTYGTPFEHERPWAELPSLLAVVVLAVLVGLAFDRSVGLGVVVACLPVVPLLLSRPAIAGVIGVACLPMSADLLGNGRVRLSLPDVVLALSFLGILTVANRQDWRSLLPVWPFITAYAAFLTVAVAAHVDAPAIINSAQRLQIVIVPLVVGAICLRGEILTRALSGFVLVATAFGLAFNAGLVPSTFEFQKNPVGQYLAGALLVVVASRGPRWRWLTVPLLALSLFRTESRGALLGLVVGILALLVSGVGSHRARTALLLLPVVAVLAVTYVSLPDDVQHRATTFTSQTKDPTNHAEYTIRIRDAYRKDALRIIAAHPYVGVGVGQYRSGTLFRGTLTDDPHNVLLLEAAEGGLPLLAGFLLLVIGTAVVVWRRRRDTPLAVVALTVQASTVAHGCFDIYWVRGTPVLAWLLVGAALADAHRRRVGW